MDKSAWKKDIHIFEALGVKMLLDVNSSSLHVIDDLIYDILELEDLDEGRVVEALRGKYSDFQIVQGLKEIRGLMDEGLLFAPEVLLPVRNEVKPVVKALCLHVAHDCNLSCAYCFASDGHFGGERMLMGEEVGKKAIDFLMESSAFRRHVEVDFFGGEPLLNMDVVKKVVAYGYEEAEKRDKIIKFTLTTNGLLLDGDNVQYLNDEKMSVVLSLDGRPEVHDRMRKTKGKKGSYHIVAPKIIDFVQRRNGENYYVRGTYTHFNPDFAADAFHLADLGFKEISLEPVVAKDEDYALTEDDLPVLFQEYEKLAAEYVKRKRENRGFNFFHFNLDLSGGPCVSKRLSGCGAGFEYLAVSPEGDLYPCHQFVGQREYKVGNVEEGIRNFELAQSFRNAHIYNKEECKVCWARFFCSGGCHANALAFNGDLLHPYFLGCELEKKRVECALAAQGLLSLE
jgi:uncharacterized protein